MKYSEIPTEVPEKHRWYTARGVNWDATGLQIFDRLRTLGLRPYHNILDFGCGALRVGRHLIPYLEPHRYYGVEPADWALRAGLHDIRPELLFTKMPTFDPGGLFNVNVFPTARFDFILLSSIWTHASHRQIEEMLTSALFAGTSGVVILADYRDTCGDYLGDEWMYPVAVCHNRQCIEVASQGAWSFEELDTDTNTWCVLRRMKVRKL